MTDRIHITASGKEIQVWDDMIPANLQSVFFQYIVASRYSIGWADQNSETGARYRYLHCQMTDEETFHGGIYPYILTTKIKDHLEGYVFEKSVINLSTPSDVNFFHTHDKNGLILLYYPNPIWQNHWHGETLFSDESSKEIEYAISYKPGRLALFNSSISHSIRPQSIVADNFRFTYAMVFVKG